MAGEDLVVPSGIAWDEFKGEALEELLYWLCDALGASDLEWRAGSVGGTSRDRGRDLEATFHVPLPDGEMRPERWWVQAKGRGRTVEPQAVREAVVEVQAHDQVDVLVVASNARFSNDTRDWVGEFQATHRRPAVRLWDRDALERMLVAHPTVVARVAPRALSDDGRLRAATSRYWNRQQLPPARELDRFWAQRGELAFDERAILMVVVGEAACEGLIMRPWGAELNEEALVESFAHAMLNLAPLVLRAEVAGVDHDPLVAAIAHLAACCVSRIGGAAVTELFRDPWQFAEQPPQLDDSSREELRDLLTGPIIRRLFTYYGTACMADCERMLGELEPEPRDSPEHRWLTLLPAAVPRDDAAPRAETLLMQRVKAPCRVGLPLTEDHGCPFGAVGDRDLGELMTELRIVINKRLAETVADRPAGSRGSSRDLPGAADPKPSEQQPAD